VDYRIAYADAAKRHIRALRGDGRARVLDGIEEFLSHDAEHAPPNGRRRMMRPNGIAQWRLRLDPYRVYYDVTDQRVTVKAVGIKRGERVFTPSGEELQTDD
jgi:mRNA-degrading endonuclease RelE of RelBE toxin-antitoxin system